MAAGDTQITIAGGLTGDPELRLSGVHTAVLKFIG